VKKSILIFILIFKVLIPSFSQNHDSTFVKPHILHVIVPLGLIGGGLAINNMDFKNKQINWRNQNYPDFNNHIDDLMQLVPHAAVFGFDWIGVKSKHSFNDKIGLMFTGGIIMLGTVNTLKYTTNQLRPDGSAENSFPSGHTANAFFGATILAKEYSDKSILIAIGGYSVATATGAFRMLNNRHWASDVLVGAGIGILSAEAAYSVYPWLKEKIGSKGKNKNITFVPVYDGYTMGGDLVIGF
jgi:membrane-associated phospholipid phosphatase